VAPGDQITVKVLRVDDESGKISLGLKQLQDDPWAGAAAVYQPGQLLSARVTRIADFGVFVELAPGIEALLPASETGLDRGADMRKTFPIGSQIDVVVLEVDAANHRIRVSKKAVAIQREQAEVREYTSRQDTQKPSASIGSLADKLRHALQGDGDKA
jgi:ribosomal protein S1